ncbi:hypothetical protein ABT404_35285 [Streptomyces hyaluromycini]|uniref:Uncharacterized protein n=1 Tax=Streptomyces hyaluromycini TaxID=1377993 RepID=A0ABV1X6L8_9ACTN
MQTGPLHAHPAGHRRAVAGTCPHPTALLHHADRSSARRGVARHT